MGKLKRVSPQFAEGIPDADGPDSQDLFPDCFELAFQLIPRFHKGLIQRGPLTSWGGKGL